MAYTVQAQRFNSYENNWKISAGLNAVGSLGTRNPVERLDEFGFRFPLAFAVERQWSKELALEQDITFNGFKSGQIFDNVASDKKIAYFSTNTTLKWYFTDYLFDAEWLDLYVGGGVGLFYMDDFNTSANLSAGAQYWFNQNFGVKLQSTGKFAANPKNHRYANNHFQYVLAAVFRL
ncbi:hypothetical protein [Gelidibacter sediminis]|nr:hypothetical protein [Gelidibacter sediminis]